MKIKHVFMTLGLAAVSGLGVGAGLKAGQVKEVKAATEVTVEDGYYLDGSYVGWVHNNAKKMTLVSGTTYKYDGLFLSGHDNYDFKVFKAEGKSVADSDWFNCSATPTIADGLFDYYGNNWYDNCASIKFDSGIRVVKITVDVAAKTYQFDFSAPTLTIGDVSQAMTWNGTEHKYVKTINGVSAGEAISIETASGDKLNSFESTAWNNIYDDSGTKRILSSGDVDVYLGETNWVSGYSENLHNLVSGFLSDTISAGVCANPTTIYKDAKAVWAYYKDWYRDTSSAEKVMFQTAVTEIGSDPSSYLSGNELSLAAARYVHLMQKYQGLEAFQDVVIGSNININPITNNSNDTLTIAIVATTAISLLTIGGFFFIRKRKESK